MKNRRRKSAGNGLTALALGLSKHLGSDDGNLVFSPLSVYAALALVAAGAGGDTRRELLAALGARNRGELAEFVSGVADRALTDRSSSDGPAVAFASGVWHDAAWALLPEYRDEAAESYKAVARGVDFKQPDKAIKEINSWVASATNNFIPSIVNETSVGPDTNLVLANAIYFKGRWETPFLKAHTTVDKFYRLDGGAVDAPFMSSGRRQFIAVRNGFKVLKLPYKSSSSSSGTDDELPRYSMYVFLPDARDGLPALVDKIASSGGIRRDHLPEKKVAVGDFQLPKFKLSFSDSLRRVLTDHLGIKAAFDPEHADLSGMASCDDAKGLPLYVSDVLHKAVLEVNEEGTEAAAATAVIHCYTSSGMSPPRTVDFVADHPFVFFLIEEVSGAIVFAGHVLDPTTLGLQ